jgi:hypothetical protein
MVITTKSQLKTRAQKPSEEELATAGTSSESQSQSSSSAGGSPETWTQKEDGSFEGSNGSKHWGDRYPKVAVGSRAEAEALIKELDPTAKVSKGVVKSQQDTLETFIVDVGGRTIVSGPLARTIAQARGLLELTSGDGNPTTAVQPQEGAGDEAGTG